MKFKNKVLLLALAVLWCFGFWCAGQSEVLNLESIYKENLRLSLFAGFLSIGGFLLALKTFIIVQMKEGVYDHEMYSKRHEEAQLLGGSSGSRESRYAPLRRLTDLLVWSVFASLFTAVAQLTLGYIPNRIAISVCLGLAVFSMLMVFISWHLIRKNLQTWFDLLDDAKKEG